MGDPFSSAGQGLLHLPHLHLSGSITKVLRAAPPFSLDQEALSYLGKLKLQQLEMQNGFLSCQEVLLFCNSSKCRLLIQWSPLSSCPSSQTFSRAAKRCQVALEPLPPWKPLARCTSALHAKLGTYKCFGSIQWDPKSRLQGPRGSSQRTGGLS